MKHQLHETPRERLSRVMSYGRPYRRQVHASNYLIGVALMILIALLVVVAVLAVSGAENVLGGYADWIRELAK